MLAFSIAFAKGINTTSSIDHFLLAGVERVALSTNIQVQVFGQRGANRKLIATTALHVGGVVSRMNTLFHGDSLKKCLAMLTKKTRDCNCIFGRFVRFSYF